MSNTIRAVITIDIPMTCADEDDAKAVVRGITTSINTGRSICYGGVKVVSVDANPLLTPAERAAKAIQENWPYDINPLAIPKIRDIIEEEYKVV